MQTPAALADEAAGILAAFGALGCEVKRKLRSQANGASRQCEVRAYFDRLGALDLNRVTRVLEDAGMLIDGNTPTSATIVDPGWATMWQKRFEPFPIGKRFLIVPPWDRAASNGRDQIVIQPGQAFGTGHHGSTRGTLLILEELFEHRRFDRALDVGTGSGILAIAMRKLGVDNVTAIDLDAIALDNAVENAELNKLDGSVRFSVAPLTSIRGRFDLITANILSSVLIPMAPDVKRRLRPGGSLVLAGILAPEVDSVTAAYAPELKLRRVRADRTWRALLFER